jgi:hypothetical protein
VCIGKNIHNLINIWVPFCRKRKSSVADDGDDDGAQEKKPPAKKSAAAKKDFKIPKRKSGDAVPDSLASPKTEKKFELVEDALEAMFAGVSGKPAWPYKFFIQN